MKPRADDGDLRHRQRLEGGNRQFGILRRFDSGILLQLVGGEEEEDELSRHVGHRHLAEFARLLAIPVGDTALVTRRYLIDCGNERRIIAAGLGQRLLARFTQHDCAARGIAIEQHALHASGMVLTLPSAFGDLASALNRDAAQDRRMHQLVDQAEQRLLGAHLLAGEMRSSAFVSPILRGRRCVPPAPGIRPSWTSGNPRIVFG